MAKDKEQKQEDQYTWDVVIIDVTDEESKARGEQNSRVSGPYPSVNHLRKKVERDWPHWQFVRATSVNPEVTEPPEPQVDPKALDIRLPEPTKKKGKQSSLPAPAEPQPRATSTAGDGPPSPPAPVQSDRP